MTGSFPLKLNRKKFTYEGIVARRFIVLSCLHSSPSKNSDVLRGSTHATSTGHRLSCATLAGSR